MYNALIYKEWLKIRWAFWGMTLLSLLILTYVLLNIAYGMESVGPKNFWGFVILMNYPFFTDIQYIPVLAGIVLAFAQFSPEMNSSRLKLTMHLPAKENTLLFQMISIGFFLLLGLFILISVLVGTISGFYFPKEVVSFVLNTSFSWSIGGLVAYFLSAAIIIEPVWSRRLVLIPFSLGFLDLFISTGNPHYQLEVFFLFSGLLTSVLILLPAYHFKRGI
ncbi:MAG: hypothetical protein P4L35_16985 [Ignavibacteriaceae bacterium]|nr:hypothetical protein [Ignavibacteriaceae bacterium]